MVRGQVSRLIYIDSKVNTHGDRTRVLLPSRSFTCSGSESLSLTLQSFSMRRQWYNINLTNNTGYVFVNGQHYEFSILPGSYTMFDDPVGAAAGAESFQSLRLGIQFAMTSCLATHSALQTFVSSISVTYNALLRKYSFDIQRQSGYHSEGVEIRCFAIKSGKPPFRAQNQGATSTEGVFSDVFEILGASPIRDENDPIPKGGSLEDVTPLNAAVGLLRLESRFPAALNTLDAIYLHLSGGLETGNFMTTSLDAGLVDNMRLVESSIFARIPFPDSTFDENHEMIEYFDAGGDAFQSMLTRKSLENLELRVTDSKGRSLASANPQQSDLGLLGFTMSLRFDIFVPNQPKEAGHGVVHKAPHPPSVTHQ